MISAIRIGVNAARYSSLLNFLLSEAAFSPRQLSPLAGFIGSEATATSWPDTTGNGNDLGVVTGTPDTDLYRIKDDDAVSFNNGEYYSTTSGNLLDITLGSNSIYAVHQLRYTSGSNTSYPFAGRVGSNTRFGCYLRNDSDVLAYSHSDTAYQQRTIAIDYDTKAQVLAMRKDGVNITINHNDTEYSYTDAKSYSLGEFYVGSGNLIQTELWVFDRLLTAEEHAQMMAYCNAKTTYEVLNDLATATAFASNGAIYPQWSGSAPAGLYDSVSDKTFFVWQSTPDMDDLQFSIQEYDHDTESFGTKNDGIATYTYAAADYHGVPAMCMDYQGYIHVFGGNHNTSCEHTVSDNPRDASAFTEQTPIGGTYTYPFPAVVGNDIYLFQRAQSGSKYDLSLRKTATLSNGSATWDTELVLATFGDSSRFYTGDVQVNGTDIYLVAHEADGGDTIRDNVYLLIYDTVNDRIRNIDSSTVIDAASFPLDATDLDTNFKIHDTGADFQCGNTPKMLFDSSGNLHVSWMQGEETTDVWSPHHMFWNGSAWSTPTKLGAAYTDRYGAQNMFIDAEGAVNLTFEQPYEFEGPSFDRNLSIMTRKLSGNSWGDTKVLFKAATKPIGQPLRILNGHNNFLLGLHENATGIADYDGTLKLYGYGSSGFIS